MVLLNIVKNTIVSNNSMYSVDMECGVWIYGLHRYYSTFFKNKAHSYAKNIITVTSLYVETTLLRPSLSHRVYSILL